MKTRIQREKKEVVEVHEHLQNSLNLYKFVSTRVELLYYYANAGSCQIRAMCTRRCIV